MKTIDEWLTLYGRDHQNPVNKLIHWICVPVILFTVFGLLMAIPFPLKSQMARSIRLQLSFSSLDILFKAIFSNFCRNGASWIFFLWANRYLSAIILPSIGLSLWQFSLIVFVIAWIFQFIGHKIEG